MIKIIPLGKTYYEGFIVDGHADFAEHGQDIVCASVSAITQMVAFELQFKGNASYRKLDDKGMLIVMISNTYGDSELYVDMMLRSLRALQQQYPEQIEVEEEK